MVGVVISGMSSNSFWQLIGDGAVGLVAYPKFLDLASHGNPGVGPTN